jgi:hypothetical protein
MPLIDMSLLFDIVMPYIFFGFMGLVFGMGLLIIFIAIMTILMPKPVLEKYFKPPYFKVAECAFLRGVLFGPIRTVMFMRVLSCPSSGKKRGMTEAYKLAPRWYIILSRTIIISIFGITGLFLIVFSISGIYTMFYAK